MSLSPITKIFRVFIKFIKYFIGIVVRMFFIGYDLRDMPSMSQTFIRQRILASDDRTSQYDSSNLSSSEQMKYLRYSIHLRLHILNFH